MSTSRMMLSLKACIAISAALTQVVCDHFYYPCRVSVVKWTRNMYSMHLHLQRGAALLFSLSPPCLSSLTIIHTHLTQTNMFILGVTAFEHFLLSSLWHRFHIYFFFFPTSFCIHLLLGSPLYYKRHICVTSMFKSKCTCVSEGTAVWGQENKK